MSDDSDRAGLPTSPLTETEDRQWAMLAHFGNIVLLVPAILIFVLFGRRGQRAAVESTEALNWTINVTALYLICNLLALLPGLGLVFSVIGLVLLVANAVFAIVGGVKVSGGGSFRYPVNVRWIR